MKNTKKTAKQIRRQWHADNKTFVYNYFEGICQHCKQKIDINTTKFDIHHLHYNMNKTPLKSRLYETDAKLLIEHNVIILICRPCHTIEHTAKDPNNPKQYENSYPCDLCGKIERGIMDRKKFLNLPNFICKKCFKEHKKGNLNTKQISLSLQ